MYEKGEFPIDKMISKSFNLSEINEACHKLESGEIDTRIFYRNLKCKLLYLNKNLDSY